jgi:hypothetical protein
MGQPDGWGDQSKVVMDFSEDFSFKIKGDLVPKGLSNLGAIRSALLIIAHIRANGGRRP